MTTTSTLTTDQTSATQLRQIRQVCDEAFGGSFSESDWEHTVGGHHVVVVERGTVVAHAAVVERDLVAGEERYRTGYIESVATLPAHQRRSHGTVAMRAVADLLHTNFELGVLSTGAHSFYVRLGWERWRGPTYVDAAAGLRRTAEEDDGIMVLRFGPSRAIDLTAALVCPERAGDDW